MKKTVILSLLMGLVFSMTMSAAESEALVTRLTISKLDGTEIHYALADKPTVTFSEGNIVIANGEDIASYPKAEIADFHFTTGTMGAITVVDADDTMVQFVDNNHIVISGPGITSATAYNLQGISVAHAEASNGAVTIDLSDKAAGIYLVSVPNHPTMKFLKK